MPDAPSPPTRLGDWILTATGQHFWPLDPRPEEVVLEDIAHALSNLCRWTGHTKWHYSVAQHAVAVAVMVERFSPDLALAALHHDDAEAYLGDWARPVKRSAKLVRHNDHVSGTETIDVTEDRLLDVIFVALGIPNPGRGWAVITAADDLVLHQEKKVLMPADSAPGWQLLGEPPRPAPRLPKLTPEEAKEHWLRMHRRLETRLRGPLE